MSIEKRVESLEKRCRALTVALLLCCIAVGFAVTVAASTNPEPKTLRVSGLEVVDEKGKVRMHLGKDNVYALPS